MALEIRPVSNKKEKKLFIDLEWQANKNTPKWVSPMRMERNKLLDTKKNPFYTHAEIELFIAYRDGKACGRIAAITNENHNKFHNDNTGFWGFFECDNNQETANALFDAAAAWLREKKKAQMLGPVNPSTNDECGILIEGFETRPFIMMRHNPQFYPILIENYGLKKEKDLYAWMLLTEDAVNHISDKMVRVSNKIVEKYNIKIRNVSIKNIKSEIKIIKKVYNNAWSKNWGFVPFTDDEIDAIASDLKDIADEDFMYIAEKDDQPIGFAISLPNVNEIMVNIPNGRLLPTGIFKLLTGLKKIKTVRVIILGVNKEYQFIGLGSIFYLKTIQTAKEKGLLGGETSWILEDNHAMNKAIEDMGSKLYKRYRMYSMDL